MRIALSATLFAAFIFLASCRQADAAIYTLNTSQSQFNAGFDNQGWFAQSEGVSPSNSNYFVGRFTGGEYRNHFTFVIPTLAPFESIVSVELQLRRGTSSSGNESTETIGFFDVSTAANTLNLAGGLQPTIFNDLGTGVSYGNFTVPGQGGIDDVLTFTL